MARASPRPATVQHSIVLALALHAAMLLVMIAAASRRPVPVPEELPVEILLEAPPASEATPEAPDLPAALPIAETPPDPAPVLPPPSPAPPPPPATPLPPEPSAATPETRMRPPIAQPAHRPPRPKPPARAVAARPVPARPVTAGPVADRPVAAGIPSRPLAGADAAPAIRPVTAPAAANAPAASPPPPAPADLGGAWRGALAAWLQAHRFYPELARREGIEGRVIVRFTMDGGGTVTEVDVVRSSGSSALDEAAARMLRGAHLPAPPPPAPDHLSVTLPIRYSLDLQ